MHSGFGFRVLALALAGLIGVAACTSSGNGPTLAGTQELRVRLSNEPASFDPGQTQWDYEAAVARQTFEALLRPSKDFKDVVGAAADKYSIDTTGTVYTFKLPRGAKWSDGLPVKASDFVYGFQRLLDPRLGAPYASYYYIIKNAATINGMDPNDPTLDTAMQTLGLKAIDDTTFQVTLEAPAGSFKWVASLWTSVPVRKDVVLKYGSGKWGSVAATAAQTVVGNGLYKISEDVPKDHVTLVPNSNYSGSQPKTTLTKITEYFIGDGTLAYTKYKNGELDMVGVPLANTEAVKNSPELLTIPQLVVFWVDINVTKAPFDNPKVRLAFAQAIDRDSFVKNLEKGRGLAATSLIPRGMRNYRPDLGVPQAFTAGKAKATLALSGATAVSLNGVKFIYDSGDASITTIAQFLQAQFKTNLGVDVVLDPANSTTVNHRLRTGDYQFGALSGWGADYPDSQDWFDIFTTGSNNQLSHWSNKTYDAAVTAGDAGFDNAKRDASYQTAQQILVQEAPVMFLYQRTAWLMVKPYVKGIITTPNDDQWAGDYFTWSIQLAQH